MINYYDGGNGDEYLGGEQTENESVTGSRENLLGRILSGNTTGQFTRIYSMAEIPRVDSPMSQRPSVWGFGNSKGNKGSTSG